MVQYSVVMKGGSWKNTQTCPARQVYIPLGRKRPLFILKGMFSDSIDFPTRQNVLQFESLKLRRLAFLYLTIKLAQSTAFEVPKFGTSVCHRLT